MRPDGRRRCATPLLMLATLLPGMLASGCESGAGDPGTADATWLVTTDPALVIGQVG